MDKFDWTTAPPWATFGGLAGPYDRPVWVNHLGYQHIEGGRFHPFASGTGYQCSEIREVTMRPGRFSETNE